MTTMVSQQLISPAPAGHRRGGLVRAASAVPAAAIVATLAVVGAYQLGSDSDASRPAAVAQAAAAGAPAWASRATSPFLESIAPPGRVELSDWHARSSAIGPKYAASIVSFGLVEFDARSHEIDELIISDHLDGAQGPIVSQTTAVQTATSFAAPRYLGFEALSVRSVKFIDHAAFAEYAVTWQARVGQAWLPREVTVGVNARTGAIAYYVSQRVANTTDLHPKVSAQRAAASALRAVSVPTGARGGTPSLEVQAVAPHKLVWVIPVTASPVGTLHSPQDVIVWVDATSGQAVVAAHS